jgi:cell wall-associated NlpC family hydrolase
MRKAVIGLVLVGLCFGPASCLLSMGVVLNPAAPAACLPSSVAVEQTPHLTARTSDGIAVTLDQAQLTHAATIVSVGAGTRGVGRDGILIALIAALTESHLRMLSNTTAYPDSASYPNDGNAPGSGDHDSLGLFQMRPSTGWGTVADLMDAEYQAAAFYGGPTGPNTGSPPGLLDIEGWQQLPKGAAAQAVEVSAYPNRYAAYQPVAEAILGAIATGTSTSSCDPPNNAAAPLTAGFAGAFIAAASTQLGKPYVWGGGTYTGPSGIGSDGRGPGFDCSGLVLYAAYQASGGKLRLPHYTGAQITFGQPIAWDQKEPGDLVFFTHPGTSAPHHVAIYLGAGKILHAPHTGDNVRSGTIAEFSGEVMTVRRLAP